VYENRRRSLLFEYSPTTTSKTIDTVRGERRKWSGLHVRLWKESYARRQRVRNYFRARIKRNSPNLRSRHYLYDISRLRRFHSAQINASDTELYRNNQIDAEPTEYQRNFLPRTRARSVIIERFVSLFALRIR